MSKTPLEPGFYNTNLGVTYFNSELWVDVVENSWWEPITQDTVTNWSEITPLTENSKDRYSIDDVSRFCAASRKRGMTTGFNDMLSRFTERDVYNIANLMAHKWTISAVEIQSKHHDNETSRLTRYEVTPITNPQ